MSKFRKGIKPEIPPLNTASLPDLIFTLLFFFMIVSNVRQEIPQVEYQEPAATEFTKLEEKSLIFFIYIGKPRAEYRETLGTKPIIQVGNGQMEVSEIPLYFSRKKFLLNPDEQERMTVSISADKNTEMKIIAEVENALRKAEVLNVNYSVSEE